MIELASVYKVQEAPKILYDLLVERSTEDDPFINISHRKLPTWREHLKFFDSHPYHKWFLIYSDEVPVGTCYISKKNEIGIVLLQKHRKKGYGLEAVNKLVTEYKPLKEIPGIRSGQFIANINPKNEPSIRLFSKLGFSHISNTYRL